MRYIKRFIFLAIVRVDLFFNLIKYDWWADKVATSDWFNSLWPTYDGEGTGGESFWKAIFTRG